MHNQSHPARLSGAANGERALIKFVARLTPWFAPFPSAYFVARSSVDHLDIPLPVAILIATIVEFLGLTSVHTWLWLSDWNRRKRKTDPAAPAGLALALGLVYLVATVGLTILLEVFPQSSTYAPALFPALALVGAFNLALISQQESREAQAWLEREERRVDRSVRRSGGADPGTIRNRSGRRSELVHLNDQAKAERSIPQANPPVQARRSSREEALRSLAAFFEENPGASYAAAGKSVGRSKGWVAGAVIELEEAGRLTRSKK